MLQTGLITELEWIVKEEDSAKVVGSGSVMVLSTPKLIALMENAAMNAVSNHLEDGTGTVGIKISAEHIAATPLGMKVKVKAVLTSIENRKLVFELEAFDEFEKIAFGTHERFIIHEEKFMAKVNAKSIK